MIVKLLVREIKEIEIDEETYNRLKDQDHDTPEAYEEWLKFGDKFAEPYGGWTFGRDLTNGLLAIFDENGELITEA